MCYRELELFCLVELTVRNLRTQARVDLDGCFVRVFVLFFLARMVLRVVQRMISGSGRVLALLGDLVVDARFGSLFGGMVGHGERSL